MTLTKQQYDALKTAFDNGILDHDAAAKEALTLVLAELNSK
ncbi:hypothetical protein [Leuconostoc citreum]